MSIIYKAKQKKANNRPYNTPSIENAIVGPTL
jgi:hypothetical protein